MPYTLGDIAEKIGAELVGDPTLAVQGLASLTDASAGDLSFMTNKRHLGDMQATQASAVVVGMDFEGEHDCALLKVANPDAGFALAADLIGPPDPVLPEGIHSSAVIEEGAEVDPTARIGACCVVASGARIGAGVELWAGCYVGHGSTVGDGSKFYPNVTVRERITVGQRVILHSGCVIGCDGFGYIQEAGAWKRFAKSALSFSRTMLKLGPTSLLTAHASARPSLVAAANSTTLFRLRTTCNSASIVPSPPKLDWLGRRLLERMFRWAGNRALVDT